MNQLTQIPDFSLPLAPYDKSSDSLCLDAIREARIGERTRRVVACQRLTSSALASLTDNVSELASAITDGGRFDPAADYHDSILGLRRRLIAEVNRLSALLPTSDVVSPGRAA